MKAILAVSALALVASHAGEAPKMANPMYTGWAAFKPGATVTFQSHETRDGKEVSSSETTSILKSVDAEKVSVESLTRRPEAGKAPVEFKSLGNFAKSGFSPAGPNEGDRTEGDEVVEVAGRKVKCHWTQVKGKHPESAMVFKFWVSPEIPGGTVKSEMTVESSKEGKTSVRKSTLLVTAFS